jgi:ferredoxin
MRVSVDLDLCQGHGVCESEAPSVFVLAKDTTVTIVEEHPGEGLRGQVEAAVRFCPTSALRIAEEE